MFSFGVVLLELITGRKPVDSSRPLGDESLVEWVSSCSGTTATLCSYANSLLYQALIVIACCLITTQSYITQSRPLLNHAIENQDFDELVDPRLDGNFDDVEMFQVIEAAAACIRHSAARRPKMGQVHTIDYSA